MNISYRTKHEGEVKTIKLISNPLQYGLGYYKDIEGNTWDIMSIIGATHTSDNKPYINARLVDGSLYYSTASDANSYGFHQWKPYYFEVIEK